MSETKKEFGYMPVSYTHLDVYKRQAEDIFTVEISLASGDLDHRVKLLSETDQCFATLTAPDTFSRNFIVSVLKNAVKQMKDDGINSPKCLLRRVCLEYGWTYQVTCPEITLKL